MFNDKEIDVFKEIINIGVGKAANLLNTIINKHISLQVPYIQISKVDALLKEINSPGSDYYSLVNMNFLGNISGRANLLFTSVDASLLVNTFIEEQNISSDIDSIKSGVLNEIGNIVMNSLIGTISNFLKEDLEYNVPNYKEGKLDELMGVNIDEFEDSVIVAHTKFKIEELDILGDFVLLLELGSMQSMIDKISGLEDFITGNE
jgi:chemotaxis protein CheC